MSELALHISFTPFPTPGRAWGPGHPHTPLNHTRARLSVCLCLTTPMDGATTPRPGPHGANTGCGPPPAGAAPPPPSSTTAPPTPVPGPGASTRPAIAQPDVAFTHPPARKSVSFDLPRPDTGLEAAVAAVYIEDEEEEESGEDDAGIDAAQLEAAFEGDGEYGGGKCVRGRARAL
jgi:hypothetical protein